MASTIVQCDKCGYKREINSTPGWTIEDKKLNQHKTIKVWKCRKHSKPV
jgi:hypothetical protein